MGKEGRVQIDDDAMEKIVGGVLIKSTTVTNKDTGEVVTKDPFNPKATDYLLAVDLGLGNYNITFDYKGTGLMRVSNVIYFLSIVSMFGFAILDSFYIIDKKKKEYIKY